MKTTACFNENDGAFFFPSTKDERKKQLKMKLQKKL